MSKYTEDGKPVLEPLKGMRKAAAVVVRVLFGIFLFSIVIIALPFAFVYVGLMVTFGKEVRINLKKLFRLDGGEQ